MLHSFEFARKSWITGQMRKLTITNDYVEIECFLTSRNAFKTKQIKVNEIRELSNALFATRRELNHMLFVRAKNGQLYSGSYSGQFKAVSNALGEFADRNSIEFAVRRGQGVGRIAIACAAVIYALGMLVWDIMGK